MSELGSFFTLFLVIEVMFVIMKSFPLQCHHYDDNYNNNGTSVVTRIVVSICLNPF